MWHVMAMFSEHFGSSAERRVLVHRMLRQWRLYLLAMYYADLWLSDQSAATVAQLFGQLHPAKTVELFGCLGYTGDVVAYDRS